MVRNWVVSGFCLVIALFYTPLARGQNAGKIYFTSEPSLSPDGKTIVFDYEDDLWTVPSSGGNASRLTGMDGRESNPHYSPDGKWIAFTGRQNGNANIYVMPVAGGEIRQLTWHDGNAAVESWSWDSRYIYFTSDAYNFMTTYKVAVTGGTPQRLFPNYFNWPHGFVENPKTGEWFFTESWESSRFANRKRYKGPFNPDIKSWNPKTGEYKVHTSYEGKDMWPTIDKNGNVYFVSDRVNEEYNLFKLNDDKPEALTQFKTSIKYPQVDAIGDKIVFEKDYQVYLYDVAGAKTTAVPISLPENNTLNLSENFNIAGKITDFDLSMDDKKLAFISRGELFVSDPEGKYIRHLLVKGPGRVIEVKWMADSKTLIYSKTMDGWPNWFTINADGDGHEKQLTDEKQSDRSLVLNEKRTFGVYLSGRDELRKMDLKTGKSETIVKDEFWAVENTDPCISPDDQYVAYTAKRNFEDDIFLFHFADKKILNLTHTGVSETEPSWSPDGKYLYFTTDRINPAYPNGFTNSQIYRIALDNYESDFKSTSYDDLFKSDKKDDSSHASPYPINMDGIENRWEELTTGSGNHGNAFITINKDETRVYYNTEADGKVLPLNYWLKKPFGKPEIKKVEGSEAFSYSRVVKGKKIICLLSGGKIYTLDETGSKLKGIEMDFAFTRDLATEFHEMFYETWADLDENYYDANFHGVDWVKMRDEYQAFLPFVKNRANLRTLLNDMLGELNSSHIGFYSSGAEEKTFYSYKTMATGILFDEKDPYKIASIVPNSPADKKDKDIKPGDILYAVDNQVVAPSQNREYYFSRPTLPEEVDLTLKRGSEFIKVKIHPEPASTLKTQLYDEWIAGNRKHVEEKTKDRIAYIMMKDMTDESLKKFEIEIADNAYDKDGLILDLRYNTGGNVHDKVLDILSRKPYLQWKYRDGKITTQPNFFPEGKPMVLLVNEQTLSDGEMTTEGFHQLKLGKIVGTPTYRWIIFTSGKTMVDGSLCRLPSWGCYKMNGDDIEHTGITPDVIVNNTIKDRTENKDPQLDKAIEVIMGELK